MPKYRLLRDCPHGEAGSVWEMIEDRIGVLLLADEGGAVWEFPRSTFSSWFEEIKETRKFTNEQNEAIKMQLGIFFPKGFMNWLDENTER